MSFRKRRREDTDKDMELVYSLYAPGPEMNSREPIITTRPGFDRTVFHVRTGGYQGFLLRATYPSSLENWGSESVATAIASTALTECLTNALDSYHRGVYRDRVTGSILQTLQSDFKLFDVQLMSLKGLGHLDWRMQNTYILKMTNEDIIASCIKLEKSTIDGKNNSTMVEIDFTTDHLDATDNAYKYNIYLGRYLTCVSDPVVISAISEMGSLDPRTLQTSIDTVIARHVMRRLFPNTQVNYNNVQILLENVRMCIPSGSTEEGQCLKRDVDRILGIDFTNPDAEVRDVTLDNRICLSQVLSILDRAQKDGMKRIIDFDGKELLKPILYQPLTVITEGVGSSQDLFDSLNGNTLVGHCKDDYVTTSYGPQATDLRHVRNALCYNMYTDRYLSKEFDDRVMARYFMGAPNLGSVIRGSRYSMKICVNY